MFSSARTLHLLLILRRFLPQSWSRLLLRSFWSSFWKREEKKHSVVGFPEASLSGSERATLTEAIAQCYPFTRALEIGCAFGQKFHILCPLFPSIQFVGIDTDKQSVEEGQDYLRSVGIENALLQVGAAEDLSTFESNSFDVVFSCACFLYLDDSQIRPALQEALRVARKKVMFLEQVAHQNPTSSFVFRSKGHGGYWIHDLASLLENLVPREYIEQTPVPHPQFAAEQWMLLGTLTVVDVQKWREESR